LIVIADFVVSTVCLLVAFFDTVAVYAVVAIRADAVNLSAAFHAEVIFAYVIIRAIISVGADVCAGSIEAILVSRAVYSSSSAASHAVSTVAYFIIVTVSVRSAAYVYWNTSFLLVADFVIIAIGVVLAVAIALWPVSLSFGFVLALWPSIIFQVIGHFLLVVVCTAIFIARCTTGYKSVALVSPDVDGRYVAA
jgi:hypothetical protein